LTTYSTFGFETIRLLEERLRAYAVLNVVASVVAGLGAAFCGAALAAALWPA
jgi:CrcB protein